MSYTYSIKSALFGVAVGDALGVPVEFRSREAVSRNPVTDMWGYGTHNQPSGTWSDDSSMTFCLAEALTHGYDLSMVGRYFVRWANEGYWSARGEVFDIGISTRRAISLLAQGHNPATAGGTDSSSNGNGSLMRILPLLFYLADRPVEERFELTRQVSSLTHAHVRSVIACFYYLEYARLLLLGLDKLSAYDNLKGCIPGFLASLGIEKEEVALFRRLLVGDINVLPGEEIQSSGYVLHTLEAAIWCLLTTDSYPEAVLKAVNLGDDTDTTGAVAGGIAGLLYGLDGIPEGWIDQLARKEDIEQLSVRLAEAL